MIIPRRVFLPSTVIAAFPAFTTPTPLDLPEKTEALTFYVTYTEGAAGGRPVFRVLYGSTLVAVLPGEDARDTVIDSGSLVITTPNGRFDFYMSEARGPDPAGATITYIVSCTAIPGGVRRANLLVAEVGVPGTPGTVSMTVTGDG